MTRLDTRQQAPLDPTEDLLDALREALDRARRWAGVPVEPDTGERAPMRQWVPA